MSEYLNDRQWSDRFIPDICNKVGPCLLTPSPFHIDAKQAADLVLIRARDMMIAARVRRHGYADRYPFEFTIRCHRESGAKTEMEKLCNGFGDAMFYGHADQFKPIVTQWMLIDLDIWRGVLLREGWNGWKRLAAHKQNHDGTEFLAFDARRFPREMIIAGTVKMQTWEAA